MKDAYFIIFHSDNYHTDTLQNFFQVNTRRCEKHFFRDLIPHAHALALPVSETLKKVFKSKGNVTLLKVTKQLPLTLLVLPNPFSMPLYFLTHYTPGTV